MESLAPCVMCGCTNYEIRAGFYVCTECNVQSQGYQEQSFCRLDRIDDEDNDTQVVLSQSIFKERELTSWECYNIILSGLINELINMGASPNVKVIAFQLWVRYLQKIEAAFISKKETALPKLPMGFKNRDAQILYGVNNLREKIFKGYVNCSSKTKRKIPTDNDADRSIPTKHLPQRILRMRQRQLAASELSNTGTATGFESECDSLVSLSSLRSSQSKRIKIGFMRSAKKHISSAKKILEESMKSSDDDDDDDDVMEQQKRKQLSYLISKARYRRYDKQLVLSMSMLVCVCQLALYLNKETIHLSDILRWGMEGKFSVNRPEVFLQDKCKAPNITPFVTNTYHGIQNEIGFTASFLEINSIPTPDLYSLVERYCFELQLPEDFTKCVHSIMSLHQPEMKYRTHRNFPQYECRALGFILFAAKLLFSLNDIAEKTQSDFADLYNRHIKDDCTQRLFCWKQWVKYIECRRVTLARFNYCMDQKYYKSCVSSKQNFIDYWEKTKPLYTIEKSQLSDVFRLFTQNVLKNLNNEDTTETMNLPSSLTPQADGLQYLLTNRADLIPPGSREILNRNFRSTAVGYLLYAGDDSRFRKVDSVSVHIKKQFTKSATVVENEVRSDPFYKTITTHLPPKHSVDIDFTDDLIDSSKIDRYGSRLKKSSEITEGIYETPTAVVNGSEKSTLDVHMQFRNYVFYHGFSKHHAIDQFDELMERKFSSSFSWLLKECSAMINAECKDLYVELMRIESTVYKKFVDKKYSPSSIKFNNEEW